MGKVSKNARTDRGKFSGEKNMVKVVKAVKNKNGAYSFKQKVMHKDTVKDFLNQK
ncbi:MAG: DUF4295 family protein [Chitinophagales bacterium]